MSVTLPEIARALNGKVSGRQVLCPGPGHSRKDRSLSVRLSDAAPDGFVVHSHAGDDWRLCRDFVADALGLARDRWRDQREPDPAEDERRREARRRAEEHEKVESERRQGVARRMWDEARDPRGSIVETYLNSRGLDLSADIAGTVIRFHPACAFGEERLPCMLAAIRCVRTSAIVGVHRTALDPEGRKIGRKVFGSATAAAVMLDPAGGELVAGEGIETTLTARQIGLGPAWSLVSTSNIGALPIIDGVQTLTVLAEIDTAPNRPSATAFARVAERWQAAGRRVDRLWPPIGCGDLNDAIRRDVR